MFYNCYYCCDVTDVMVVMSLSLSLMCLSVIDTITSVTVDLLARIITNVSEKLRPKWLGKLGEAERGGVNHG